MTDRTAAAEMIAKLEKDAEERGYRRGFADGIQRTKAAIAALNVEPENELYRALLRVATSKSSSNNVVLGVITRAPGLTGRQLVDRCVAEGTPVEERTLRTALFRLKTKGEIKKVGEGWYPTENKGRELPLHENKGVFS